MPEISVQVVQPHGTQPIGLVTDNDTGITMILHAGGGDWEPVAGVQRSSNKVLPVPRGFVINDDLVRRLEQAHNAVREETISRGCGIALSTTNLDIVTV